MAKPPKKPELRLIANNRLQSEGKGLPLHVMKRREHVALQLAKVPVRRPTWVIKDDPYKVDCHRGRFVNPNEDGACTYRDIRISIANAGRYFLTVEFREWRLHEDAVWKQFFQAADSVSDDDLEFAETVLFHWGGFRLPLYSGTVVQVGSIVVDNQIEQGDFLWMLFEDAVKKEFASRASMALFQVIPIAHLGTGSDRQAGFDKQRRRLMRFFEYFTGAMPLPLESGIAGWMWRPLKDNCPGPMISSQYRWELG